MSMGVVTQYNLVVNSAVIDINRKYNSINQCELGHSIIYLALMLALGVAAISWLPIFITFSEDITKISGD